jgi:hypothetical protein
MTQKLFFTGWQQKEDNYLNYPSYSYHHEKYEDIGIKLHGKHYQSIAGWSLGSIIACRLLCEEIISCDELILLAPIARFDKEKIAIFIENFQRNPHKALVEFQRKVNGSQSCHSSVCWNPELRQNSLYWLEFMRDNAIFDMKLQNLPQKIIIIHGKRDLIVSHKQAEELANITGAEFILKGSSLHYIE